MDEILENLTGDDVRHLTQAEDELTVIGNFERIFPTSQTHKYFCFMEKNYHNRLFDAWETKYEKNRSSGNDYCKIECDGILLTESVLTGIDVLRDLCAQKIHLKVASQTSIRKVCIFALLNNHFSHIFSIFFFIHINIYL